MSTTECFGVPRESWQSTECLWRSLRVQESRRCREMLRGVRTGKAAVQCESASFNSVSSATALWRVVRNPGDGTVLQNETLCRL